MKRILDWVKANLAIVGLVVLILIILPASWVASSMWNKRIRTAQETTAGKDWQDLNSASTLNYTIPAALPGEQAWEQSGPPNREMIQWVREQRERQASQIGKVVDLALEKNRDGHEVLVEDLFPQPRQGQAELKTLAMAERFVGGRSQAPVYQTLLESIDAGPPVDPAKLTATLADLEARELEKARVATGSDKLGPEEQEELSKRLVGQRLAEYQRRASEISAYATPDVIVASYPKALPSQPPTVEDCFGWQYDYWVVQDLVRAIGLANSRADGSNTPVTESVVKRIERIVVSPLVTAAPARGRFEDDYADAGLPGAEPNFEVSVTGRQDNKHYDVRTADLTLIVASDRLPELLSAISRTNFMTVIGLDVAGLSPAEVWADLDRGYLYGSDHVARVNLKVETVWLREWTAPLTPPRVLAALTGEGGDAVGGEADSYDDRPIRSGKGGSRGPG